MSTYMKAGQPWLYDSSSGDIVGVKDADGGEALLARYATDRSGKVTGLEVAGGVKVRVGGDSLDAPVVLYEGDSITARADYDINLPSVEGVTNAYAGYFANAYPNWELAELGGIYDYDSNAVSGETISQITTRLLATDISGYAAVSLMAGTNDISAAADVPADIALIEDVCQYCLEQRKPLRLATIITKTTASMTADNKAYILAFNTAIKKLPQSYPNVFVGDAFLGVQDTTSADPAPIANALSDTTHPNNYGSFRMSRYGLKDAMEDALRYAGYGSRIDNKTAHDDGVAYTELLTNTDFKTQTGGTDSTAGILTTGTVPAGWRLINASSTDIKSYFPFYVHEAKRQRGIWVTAYVYEIGDTVTDSGGAYLCTAAHIAGATFAGDVANWKRVWSAEYCWQLVFTGDAANDGITIQRASNLSIAATDVVQGWCCVAVEGAVDKIQGTDQGFFYLDCYGVTYRHFSIAMYPGNSSGSRPVGERYEGMFRTPRQAFFSGGGTIATQQFKIEQRVSAAGTASVIIYKPSVRKY